jgi:hypothetical protein
LLQEFRDCAIGLTQNAHLRGVLQDLEILDLLLMSAFASLLAVVSGSLPPIAEEYADVALLKVSLPQNAAFNSVKLDPRCKGECVDSVPLIVSVRVASN